MLTSTPLARLFSAIERRASATFIVVAAEHWLDLRTACELDCVEYLAIPFARQDAEGEGYAVVVSDTPVYWRGPMLMAVTLDGARALKLLVQATQGRGEDAGFIASEGWSKQSMSTC